jgi:hypothetical protein
MVARNAGMVRATRARKVVDRLFDEDFTLNP